jgi:hypothetical protein
MDDIYFVLSLRKVSFVRALRLSSKDVCFKDIVTIRFSCFYTISYIRQLLEVLLTKVTYTFVLYRLHTGVGYPTPTPKRVGLF